MQEDAQAQAEQYQHLLARADEAEDFLDRYFAPAPLSVFGVDLRAAVCLVMGAAFAAAAIATMFIVK